MKKFGLALILAALSVSCAYGRASPSTCYAKHVRDGRGKAGSYERCLANYERARDNPRPRLGAWAALAVIAGAAVVARQDPEDLRAPVYVYRGCQQWAHYGDQLYCVRR